MFRAQGHFGQTAGTGGMYYEYKCIYSYIYLFEISVNIYVDIYQYICIYIYIHILARQPGPEVCIYMYLYED
jgi:hypothetical protein